MRRIQPLMRVSLSLKKSRGGEGGTRQEHLSSFVGLPTKHSSTIMKIGILPVSSLFATLPLILLAINPDNPPPAGKTNKDVRARYPSLILMRESLMPNPTARPQKSTRHVLEMPKERPQKMRNTLMESSASKLRRKKPISARYKSIFGHSKPLRGTEFTPSNIFHYTGKLAQSRRQTFKWSPSGRTEDYLLFPRN